MPKLIIETEWSKDETPIQKNVVSGETELLDAPYELHDLCAEGFGDPSLYDRVMAEIFDSLKTFKVEHFHGLRKIQALADAGCVGYWKLSQ